MVTKLSDCEIFVFGSNLAGHHGGGAAKTAHKLFGAQWGVGDGPTGHCYALPTMQGGVETIKPYADKFIQYAIEHPDNRFLLTPVGCGIAGFKDSEMAPLFSKALDVPNIAVPKQWLPYMLTDTTLGLAIPRGKDYTPKFIDESILKGLCELHQYEIGAGIKDFLPNIEIRYTIENGKFRYAKFGDFSFWADGGLYVWINDDKLADSHEQDIVESLFEDQCYGRGYLLRATFCGINTHIKDSNGEEIFTGDVLDVESMGPLALGMFEEHEGPGYCFILDNHYLSLDDCKQRRLRHRRIGTVYFRLEWGEYPIATTAERTMKFNACWDPEESKRMLYMSKYTPNYDQEFWKYQGLETLGVEYNWRKSR